MNENFAQILLAVASQEELGVWVDKHAEEFRREWEGKLLSNSSSPSYHSQAE